MDIRIRLRPWLEGRLNEGWIEGLSWIDREKGIFKIPWKHHSKHTWTEHDAAIFKDWAVVTGRYREGIDSPDWPMWKTRLRCALNKAPDIQEVKQRHNLHCDEPFKVYRFVSKTESLWRANATRNASMIFDGITSMNSMIHNGINNLIPRKGITSLTANGAKRPTIYFQRLPGSENDSRPIAFIHRTSEGIIVKKLHVPQQPSQLSTDYLDASNDASTCSPNGHSSEHLDIGATQEVPSCGSGTIGSFSNYDAGSTDLCPTSGRSNSVDRSITDASGGATIIRRITASPARYSTAYPAVQHQTFQHSYAGTMAPESISSIGIPVGHNQSLSNPVAFLPDIMEPEYHQMGVRIQHLNIRVKDTIVTNPNGCCIFYGRYDEINSPAAPDPIEAQIPHHVSDANKSYVDLLLDNMVRGIILSATRGSIYVERMCKCAVFVYIPTPDGENIFLRKLGRRERERIFDYEQFMLDLDCFRAGQRPRPHFEVVLAFGQQLRSGLSADGLLVWCRIASCRAWFQLHKRRRLVPGQTSFIPVTSDSSSATCMLPPGSMLAPGNDLTHANNHDQAIDTDAAGLVQGQAQTGEDGEDDADAEDESDLLSPSRPMAPPQLLMQAKPRYVLAGSTAGRFTMPTSTSHNSGSNGVILVNSHLAGNSTARSYRQQQQRNSPYYAQFHGYFSPQHYGHRSGYRFSGIGDQVMSKLSPGLMDDGIVGLCTDEHGVVGAGSDDEDRDATGDDGENDEDDDDRGSDNVDVDTNGVTASAGFLMSSLSAEQVVIEEGVEVPLDDDTETDMNGVDRSQASHHQLVLLPPPLTRGTTKRLLPMEPDGVRHQRNNLLVKERKDNVHVNRTDYNVVGDIAPVHRLVVYRDMSDNQTDVDVNLVNDQHHEHSRHSVDNVLDQGDVSPDDRLLELRADETALAAADLAAATTTTDANIDKIDEEDETEAEETVGAVEESDVLCDASDRMSQSVVLQCDDDHLVGCSDTDALLRFHPQRHEHQEQVDDDVQFVSPCKMHRTIAFAPGNAVDPCQRGEMPYTIHAATEHQTLPLFGLSADSHSGLGLKVGPANKELSNRRSQRRRPQPGEHQQIFGRKEFGCSTNRLDASLNTAENYDEVETTVMTEHYGPRQHVMVMRDDCLFPQAADCHDIQLSVNGFSGPLSH